MANCRECKEQRRSKQNEVATISVFEHENTMAKMERIITRLWIALIISTVLLFTLAAIKLPQPKQEILSYEVQNDVQEQIQTPR